LDFCHLILFSISDLEFCLPGIATPELALSGEILPLHFIQGQNDRSEGLRMTISEGALNDNEKGRNDNKKSAMPGYKGSLLLG